MNKRRDIVTALPLRNYRKLAVSAAFALSIAGSMLAQPASAQSLTDRFKGLFGGGSSSSQPAAPPVPGTPPGSTDGTPDGQTDMNCPPVSIRAGASTYAVAATGKDAVGNDVRYQATITKTARDCTRNGGEITARIGIQGRVIAGPAGAPETVQVPIRVAVVQGGVNERTIATKAYRTTVSMAEDGSVPFTLVADDLVYPLPADAVADSYIFYIGFDPQALAPEPKAPVKRKKK
jgi:hypothetical protein